MDKRVVQYYTGELSSDERKALLQEAFENPDLKKEMMDYQHVQALMGLHPEAQDTWSGRMSWERFSRARKVEQWRRSLKSVMRYAVVLMIGIVSTWWITSQVYRSTGKEWSVTEQQLTVPAGQRAHLVLPDGSKVWVNASSILSYPSAFVGNERRVQIVGEAFFEVAKNEKPFIVSTGKMDVKALGTQFDVYNYPADEMNISLLQGSVKVYQPQRESHGVALSPGQQVREEQGRWIVSAISQDPVLWKEGIYAFQNQSLQYILRKLEMYYDVKFVVKNPELLKHTYTGKFRQRDGVMEVLRIIQKIYPFRVHRPEGSKEITLYK